jgi:tRNA pseudouridine38-40 synthase
MRYFLKLAYQGTHYHGWQIQQNAVTVQGLIEKQLSMLFSLPISITGSSRTDAGVHAQQQWAHVDFPFSIDTIKLQQRMNALLPADIAVLDIYPVTPIAHARFSATSRTYQYSLSTHKNPFLFRETYFFSKKLDIAAMKQAAALLLQYQDFETFSKLGEAARQRYVCNISEASWQHGEDQLIFRITANRFLRGMVRAIVGHLLKVGLAKCSVPAFEFALKQKDRSLGASLAPACGLTLTQVQYPTSIFCS